MWAVAAQLNYSSASAESRASVQEMKQFKLDRGRPTVSVSYSRSSFHFENTRVDSTSGAREGIPANQATRGPVNQFQEGEGQRVAAQR